jgi:hypothetical protein
MLQHLDGNCSPDRRIVGAVDNTHPTRTDDVDYGIFTDLSD